MKAVITKELLDAIEELAGTVESTCLGCCNDVDNKVWKKAIKIAYAFVNKYRKQINREV